MFAAGGGDCRVRAAHWMVIGHADGAAIDVAVWCELLRACDGKGHAPLVVACVCRCHACFAFVDKRTASRVLMAAFELTPATSAERRWSQIIGNNVKFFRESPRKRESVLLHGVHHSPSRVQLESGIRVVLAAAAEQVCGNLEHDQRRPVERGERHGHRRQQSPLATPQLAATHCVKIGRSVRIVRRTRQFRT